MILRLFRGREGRARVVRLCCAALLVAGGCTPSYNWRELVVADGYVQAAFPAKVETETRTISLGGLSLPFTLTTAQVDRAMFAVGSAPLPEALATDPAARQALGQALMQSLYVNMGAAVPETLPSFGDEILARGRAGQEPAWLLARVWVTDTMLIDAVAAGTEQDLPVERAQEFVRAVQLKQ